MLNRLAFYLPPAALFFCGKFPLATLALLVCLAFCVPEKLEAFIAKRRGAGHRGDD